MELSMGSFMSVECGSDIDVLLVLAILLEHALDHIHVRSWLVALNLVVDTAHVIQDGLNIGDNNDGNVLSDNGNIDGRTGDVGMGSILGAEATWNDDIAMQPYWTLRANDPLHLTSTADMYVHGARYTSHTNTSTRAGYRCPHTCEQTSTNATTH